MTAHPQALRASLIGESWAAMKESGERLIPVLSGVALLLAVMNYCLGLRDVEAPLLREAMFRSEDLVRQQPDAGARFMDELLGLEGRYFTFWLEMMLGYALSTYLILVGFLRPLVDNPPAYSLKGFFHWLGAMALKFLRPILWNIIPIIGQIMYLRSLVRYALVSPLAIFDQPAALRTSWDLTRGHWWRLFLSQLGLGLGVGFAIFAVAFIPMIVLIVTTHGDTQSPVFNVVNCAFGGIAGAIMQWVGVVFSCVAYRVLLQEWRPDVSPPQVNVSPSF